MNLFKKYEDGYIIDKLEKIIDKLIEIAEKENAEKNKNNYTYKSNIVGKFGGGVKNPGK